MRSLQVGPVVLAASEPHLQIVVEKVVDLVVPSFDLLDLRLVTKLVVQLLAVQQAGHDEVVVLCVDLFLHVLCGRLQLGLGQFFLGKRAVNAPGCFAAMLGIPKRPFALQLPGLEKQAVQHVFEHNVAL